MPDIVNHETNQTITLDELQARVMAGERIRIVVRPTNAADQALAETAAVTINALMEEWARMGETARDEFPLPYRAHPIEWEWDAATPPPGVGPAEEIDPRYGNITRSTFPWWQARQQARDCVEVTNVLILVKDDKVIDEAVEQRELTEGERREAAAALINPEDRVWWRDVPTLREWLRRSDRLNYTREDIAPNVYAPPTAPYFLLATGLAFMHLRHDLPRERWFRHYARGPVTAMWATPDPTTPVPLDVYDAFTFPGAPMHASHHSMLAEPIPNADAILLTRLDIRSRVVRGDVYRPDLSTYTDYLYLRDSDIPF